MSKLSEEAKAFLTDTLFGSATPRNIKSAIAQELANATSREISLRTFIATARNSSNTPAIRIAALREIVKFYRGDL